MRACNALLTACFALWLCACQAPPAKPDVSATADASIAAATIPDDETLGAEYRRLAATGGKVYVMDPAASALRIYVYRGGLAARSGHNHVISAPRFLAYAHVPGEEPAQARFDLTLPLHDLVVDDPQLRAKIGGNFAGERSESDISGTRRNMLGPRGLDADQYPVVHLKSVSIAGDWPMLLADVTVTLHGVRQVVPVVLHVEHDATSISASGSLFLRQSDFGIQPFSLFGGVLSVQDVVVMDFLLTGTLME
jgi:polyisoprenoid-binding protein YceI